MFTTFTITVIFESYEKYGKIIRKNRDIKVVKFYTSILKKIIIKNKNKKNKKLKKIIEKKKKEKKLEVCY